ncbi:CD109 antigen [Syngnathus typhle]
MNIRICWEGWMSLWLDDGLAWTLLPPCGQLSLFAVFTFTWESSRDLRVLAGSVNMDLIWALVCLGVCSAATGSTQAPLFVMTGPEVLPAGMPSLLAVTVFYEFPIRIEAEVSHHSTKVTKTADFQGGVTQLLTLPAFPTFLTQSSRLNFTITGYHDGRFVFSNITNLTFDVRNISCYVQTDQSHYRPGDTVRVRAVCVQLDNLPYKGRVDLSVEDSSEDVVETWESTANHGIVFHKFTLSQTPPLGTWTVIITMHGVTDKKTFIVEHEEPPKFDVLVRTPPRVLDEEDISGSVRAIYPNGQPVQGTLNISLTQPTAVEDLTQTKEIYGSAQFFFSNGQLQSLHISSKMEDGVLIKVCVTDKSTGIEVSKTVKVHLIRNTFQLKFCDFPQSLKPSLTFFTKLSISRYDKKPLNTDNRKYSAVVDVTQWSSMMRGSTTMTLPVPIDGNVHIKFKLQYDVQMILIHARYQSTVETLTLYTNYSSPSDSYLQITPGVPAMIGSPYQIETESTIPLSKIHYVVTSRGQVVTAGSNTSSSFSLVPTLSWSPEACITVYSILPDGEIISDTARITVAQQAYVSLHWSNERARPGERVTLTVTAITPNSRVAILVMGMHDEDPQADSDLEAGQGCNMKIFSNVPLHMNEHLVDRSENYGNVHLVEKYWKHWVHRGEDQLWFDATLSDKTWTSGAITVPDGVTSLVAAALIMSDDLGLGFTPVPQKLNVAKDFSLSLNVPHYIIRREELVLEVNIINHLARDLEVILVLSESEAFEFILAKHGDISMVNAQTLILEGYGSATALFPIRPVVIGELQISVDAIAADCSESLVWNVLVKPEGVEQSFSETLFLELEPLAHNYSQSISISLPPHVVEDSQRANVVLVGDVLALSIQHLNSLVQLPIGCGEQNMIHFAPNIYVLQYLDRSNQENKEMRSTALGYMFEGYQRQLSYQKDDGSFSAFGAQDPAGSTWLTAFVLRCFLQAQPYMHIDETVINRARTWLMGLQGPQGEFSEVGRLMHTEMQEGLDNGPVALTAFVMMALLENKTYVDKHYDKVSLTITYLERSVTSEVLSNYTLCLAAYALALANSSVAGTALEELSTRADYRDGIMMWASSAGPDVHEGQPHSSQVEMASYVTLTHIQRGSYVEGIPFLKWLIKQRNFLGGYRSTQDTIVALQAVAYYAAFSGSNSINLRLLVSSSNSSFTFPINSTSYLAYQQHEINADQDIHLNIYIEGRGFAVFQMNVFYNLESKAFLQNQVLHAKNQEDFVLKVDVTEEENHDYLFLSVCVRLKNNQVIPHTGMVILDVGLLSGFALAAGAAASIQSIRKVETLPQKITLYLDSLNKSELCIPLPLVRVFKVARIQDALVQVYDYYEPTRRAATTYNSEIPRLMDACDFCGEDLHLCLLGNPIVVASSVPSLHSTTCSLCCLLLGITLLYCSLI